MNSNVCFISIPFSNGIGVRILQSSAGSNPNTGSVTNTGYGFNTSYSHTIAISISDIKIDSVIRRFKFSVNFNYLKGNVIIKNTQLNRGNYTNADIENYYLGFAIYPLDINTKSQLEISLGFQLDYLLKSTAVGVHTSWLSSTNDTTYSNISSFINY